jgi:hypothetical protein
LPLKELLKIKDSLLMMNLPPESMVKFLDLVPKLLTLEDKFSNYNLLVPLMNKAETTLKDKLMMLVNLWKIEELYVKKKTVHSKWFKQESPIKLLSPETLFIYWRTRENS